MGCLWGFLISSGDLMGILCFFLGEWSSIGDVYGMCIWKYHEFPMHALKFQNPEQSTCKWWLLQDKHIWRCFFRNPRICPDATQFPCPYRVLCRGFVRWKRSGPHQRKFWNPPEAKVPRRFVVHVWVGSKHKHFKFCVKHRPEKNVIFCKALLRASL